VKSKGSKKRSPKKKAVKKKPAKKKMMKCAGSKPRETVKFYICIRHVFGKYVVHPAIEEQYQHDVAANANDVWYFATTKSIIDFIKAGVFGIYDSYEAAEAAILAVDSGCSGVYKPPSPTNPT
jgi:hypothetical protein